MPVSKYRSVDDMPALDRVEAPELVERIRTLWKRAFLLSPPDVVPGVTRFRSIEEANEARANAVAERMKRRATSE